MAKSFKRTNKLSMSQFLVAGCDVANADQALAAGALVSNTTALGIADGQLGVLSWDFQGTVPLGQFITAGTTATDVRAIKILQGTPASGAISSADPFEAGHRGYLDSGIIYCDNVRSVTVRKAREARLGAQAFVDFPTGCFPTCDAEYKMQIRLDSVFGDTEYGPNDDVVSAIFNATDTTNTVTDALDYTLQNTIYKMNLRSRLVALCDGSFGNKDFIVFGVNSGGGAGLAIGGITCGTTIPVMNDTCRYCVNCGTNATPVTTNMVADAPLVRALAGILSENAGNPGLASPITAASTIELIDPTTAGAAANVDSVIVIGLQRVEPFPLTLQDPSLGIPFYQTRVDADMAGSFRVAPLFSSCKTLPEEEVGNGKSWERVFNSRMRHDVHTLQSKPSAQHYYGQTYVDPNVKYTSYIIDFYDHEETMTVQEHNPKQTIMLFPSSTPCLTVTATLANITAFKAGADAGKPDLINEMPTVVTACEAETAASAATVPGIVATLDTWLISAKATNKMDENGDVTRGGPYLSV